MSRSENGAITTNNNSNYQRLCHIIKRDDFDGYGFNLHSERGKPGQYIGKVDENSPAELAGLRQGDRIIEVNGVNIGNETHKQVVQRIKAIASEVRLLVIDPNIEKKINNNNSATGTTTTTTTDGTTPRSKTPSPKIDSNASKADKTNLSINSASPTASTRSDISNNSQNNNVNVTPTPTKIDTDSNTSPIQSQKNGTKNIDTGANNNPGGSQQKSPGLNLPMTAAEMRAKLLAKKKYDPKNDTVDLRKKFEIIQKL